MKKVLFNILIDIWALFMWFLNAIRIVIGMCNIYRNRTKSRKEKKNKDDEGYDNDQSRRFFQKRKIKGKGTSYKLPEFSIKQASLNLLQTVWMIRESFQSIFIDNIRLQFLEIMIQPDSKNGLQYLLTEFEKTYVSIHMVKVDSDTIYKKLKTETNILEGRRIHALEHNITDLHFIERDLKRTQAMMREYMHSQNIFLIRIYTAFPFIQSIKKLNLFMHLFRMQLYPLYGKQLEALKSMIPFTSAIFNPNEYSNNLYALNPLKDFSKTLYDGIFIGREVHSNMPVFEDFFTNENFNTVIIAKSGAGKSFLAGMLMQRLVFDATHVVVIDVEGEYAVLAKELKGYSCTEDDISFIDGYMQRKGHIMYLINMLPLILTDMELRECEGNFAHCKTYDDFYRACTHCSKEIERRIFQYIQKEYDISEDIPDTHFLRFHLVRDDLALSLYKIVQYCLFKQTGNTILFIDEAHKVMDNIHIAKFIRQAAKRGRKYGLGICVISQDLLDFVQNKWSRAVISNASVKILLKQESIAIPLIKEVFHIERQEEYLEHVAVGEGLYIKNGRSRKVVFENI